MTVESLDRMALVVRPSQPYIDWANSFDDGGPKYDPEHHHAKVYLIDEVVDPSDIKRMLRRYWRDIFAERRYALFDCLRPRIINDTDLQAWYRFNSFLYVHEDKIPELSSEVRATEIHRHEPVPDLSPFSYRLRKSIVRLLPYSVQNGVAAAISKWRGSG